MTRKTSTSGTARNAFYAQSGGVTAVINASACGVIETARKYPRHIGKVYAGRHGIIGALTEDLIDTSKESRQTISALKHTPAGAFGSARFKLKSQLVDGAIRIEKLRAHELVRDLIDAFGEEIESVSFGKPTLEDVFVHLTGHQFFAHTSQTE